MTAFSDWRIPGTYVFDSSRSRAGYRLNKMAYSLTLESNRKRFRDDEESYLQAYGLNEEEKAAIRRRDWLALVKEHGANIYYIYKLGAATGNGLYHMGAQMRGETYEAFLATRAAKNAK